MTMTATTADTELLLTASEARDVSALLQALTELDRSLEYIFLGPIPVTSGDTDEVVGHVVQDEVLRWRFHAARDYQPILNPLSRTELPHDDG